MHLSKREAFICVGGGLLVSLIIFSMTLKIQPAFMTSEGFWAAVGLLPMIVIAGLRLKQNEKKKQDSDELKK